MHRKSYTRIFLIGLLLVALMALIVSPGYSQGGRGNGQGQGRGQAQEHNPPGLQNKPDNPGNNGQIPPGQNRNQTSETSEQAAQSSSVQEQSESLLGCQKNNPDRLDCSSLEVSGYCDATTAVFIITNTGEPGNGDMVAATSYQLLQNGAVVESGSVQLGGGQSTEIRYSGGGEITLIAEQQVGHPGNSRPRVTLNCGVPVEEPTEEPTQEVTPTEEPTPEVTPTEEPTPEVTPTEEVTPEVTPTEEVTPEVTPTEEVTPEVTPTEEVTPEVTPTEEVIPPDLYATGHCDQDGSVVFYIGNAGDAMTEPVLFTVTDRAGNLILVDALQLGAGEVYVLHLGFMSGPITLNIGDGLVVETSECYTPTEEVTPPDLMASAYCDASGGVVFEVVNVGSAMTQPVYYFVDTEDGTIIDEGWLQLGANETLPLNLGPQVGPVRLVVGDWLTYAFIECFASTEEPTPTEEVTPEVTPTEEPTPEVTPTEEVTPDVTPTEEPTPEPTEEPTPEPTEEPTPEVTPTEEVTPEPPQEYNCQKSNPDRLDCSSIEVTAYCDGPTAVFVITNTGEPGEGDMSVPTEYRLIQNGSVIESGEVQLGGGETMLVYYSGGGRITLEADQQIGHPGQSQPQATISCGG